MKSITKLQFATIILLISFIVWEIYVKQWETTLPLSDPAIRVDLVFFIPILFGLCIASILQFKNKALKRVLLLGASSMAVGVFVIGCQTPDHANQTSENNAVTIINAKQEFLSFLSASKDKPFEQQKQHWLDEIESISPEFYKSHIWGAKYIPDGWEQRRDDGLRNMFVEYSVYSPEKISHAYDLYEKNVKTVLSTFKQYFPDYDAKLQVMIVPGIGWGGSYITDDDVEYLALGLDWYLAQEKPPKNIVLLITHELFHDYHAQKRGGNVPGEAYIENSKLFWQLWDEGMATWGMGHLGNNQTAEYVMLLGIEGYDQCRDAQLAKLFIREFDYKGVDLETPLNYKKWFGGKQTKALGKDTPPMIGYYLGWRVISNTEASGISPDIFLAWTYEEARPNILEQLEIIAKEDGCEIH